MGCSRVSDITYPKFAVSPDQRAMQISRLSRSLNPAQSAGYGAQILDQVDAGASEYS